MGVQMDRNADLLLELGDELFRRVGLEKTCHILDGDHMRAAVLQLLGHVHIVSERISVIFGIQDVACVADGRLQDLILFEDFIHRDRHALDPVE